MTFTRDITEFVAKTKLTGGQVMRKLGLDAYKGVLVRSPVKTGRFRGSHRLAINEVDFSTVPLQRKGGQQRIFVVGPTGGTSVVGASPSTFGGGASSSELRAAEAEVRKARWGDTINISNNLPYARFLENGGSAQNGNAKDGIYGATFASLLAKLSQAIEELRRNPLRGPT